MTQDLEPAQLRRAVSKRIGRRAAKICNQLAASGPVIARLGVPGTKEPAERYATAAEMLADLEATRLAAPVANPNPPAPVPEPAPDPEPMPERAPAPPEPQPQTATEAALAAPDPVPSPPPAPIPDQRRRRTVIARAVAIAILLVPVAYTARKLGRATEVPSGATVDRALCDGARRECGAENLEACYRLVTCERGGDTGDRAWLRDACRDDQRRCDGNDPVACARAADCHVGDRLGLTEAVWPRNVGLGCRLYQTACQGGVMHGCAGLAACQRSGTGGVRRDERGACALDRIACDGGDARGCEGLGICLELGTGDLRRDARLACELFEKACAGHAPRSCRKLAVCYEEGLGSLASDRGRACELRVEACALGDDDPASCLQAGDCFCEGRHFVGRVGGTSVAGSSPPPSANAHARPALRQWVGLL